MSKTCRECGYSFPVEMNDGEYRYFCGKSETGELPNWAKYDKVDPKSTCDSFSEINLIIEEMEGKMKMSPCMKCDNIVYTISEHDNNKINAFCKGHLSDGPSELLLPIRIYSTCLKFEKKED